MWSSGRDKGKKIKKSYSTGTFILIFLSGIILDSLTAHLLGSSGLNCHKMSSAPHSASRFPAVQPKLRLCGDLLPSGQSPG